MWRLTKVVDGIARVNTDHDTTPGLYKHGYKFRNSIEKCLDRLALYEDTGLEPYEVQILADAAKDGDEALPYVIPFDVLKNEFFNSSEDTYRPKLVEYAESFIEVPRQSMRELLLYREDYYNVKKAGGWRAWSKAPSKLDMATMPWESRKERTE